MEPGQLPTLSSSDDDDGDTKHPAKKDRTGHKYKPGHRKASEQSKETSRRQRSPSPSTKTQDGPSIKKKRKKQGARSPPPSRTSTPAAELPEVGHLIAKACRRLEGELAGQCFSIYAEEDSDFAGVRVHPAAPPSPPPEDEAGEAAVVAAAAAAESSPTKPTAAESSLTKPTATESSPTKGKPPNCQSVSSSSKNKADEKLSGKKSPPQHNVSPRLHKGGPHHSSAIHRHCNPDTKHRSTGAKWPDHRIVRALQDLYGAKVTLPSLAYVCADMSSSQSDVSNLLADIGFRRDKVKVYMKRNWPLPQAKNQPSSSTVTDEDTPGVWKAKLVKALLSLPSKQWVFSHEVLGSMYGKRDAARVLLNGRSGTEQESINRSAALLRRIAPPPPPEDDHEGSGTSHA